jgi:hypothetical protein
LIAAIFGDSQRCAVGGAVGPYPGATWASHYGIQANPQGSREPAVANRFYDKASGRYESDQQFHQRIDTDVRKVSDKIADVTGKAPRAWVASDVPLAAP